MLEHVFGTLVLGGIWLWRKSYSVREASAVFHANGASCVYKIPLNCVTKFFIYPCFASTKILSRIISGPREPR